MRRKKTNYSVFCGLALGVVLVLLFVVFNYRIIRGREGNEEMIEALKAELEHLESRKTDLEIGLHEAEDTEHIERVLREDFLMRRPGEKKVVILTEEEKELGVKSEKEDKGEDWRRFLRIFPWID